MENASKALIIAGSVLIAILLISLGLKVFNATDGVTEQVNTTGQIMEDASFNSQFLKYKGNQKGSQVELLIGVVRSYNAKNSGNKVKVFVDDSEKTNNLSSIDINMSDSYKISFSYKDTSGQDTGKVTEVYIDT